MLPLLLIVAEYVDVTDSRVTLADLKEYFAIFTDGRAVKWKINNSPLLDLNDVADAEATSTNPGRDSLKTKVKPFVVAPLSTPVN